MLEVFFVLSVFNCLFVVYWVLFVWGREGKGKGKGEGKGGKGKGKVKGKGKGKRESSDISTFLKKKPPLLLSSTLLP